METLYLQDMILDNKVRILQCGYRSMELQHLLTLCDPFGWLHDDAVDSFTWACSNLLEKHPEVTVHSAWSSSILLQPNEKRSKRKLKASIDRRTYERTGMCLASKSMVESGNDHGIHLFPQCNDIHWWLMIVDLTENIVYSMDSMENGDHCIEAARLCSLVKVGMTKKENSTSIRKSFTAEDWDDTIHKFDEWCYVRLILPSHVQQTDNSSCGVFVCLYCDILLRKGKDALSDCSLFQLPNKELKQMRGYIFTMIMRMGEAYSRSKHLNHTP